MSDIPTPLIPKTLQIIWEACLEIWAWDAIAKGWPLQIWQADRPDGIVDITLPGKHFPEEPIVGTPANDNERLT